MSENQDISESEKRLLKACGDKVPYKSMEEAGAAAAYARWQYGDDGSGPVAYKCRYCTRFHLASR